MSIKESGEMYLETILILSKKKNMVRSIDISEYMGFSKPSVSRAMTNLKKEQYILVDPEGHIALTEKGRDVADKIYERHMLLSELLIRLGVDEKTAATDACKIEHVISDKTFDAVKNHVSMYSK